MVLSHLGEQAGVVGCCWARACAGLLSWSFCSQAGTSAAGDKELLLKQASAQHLPKQQFGSTAAHSLPGWGEKPLNEHLPLSLEDAPQRHH